MKTLFDTVSVKGVAFPNRLLRSATWERLADPQGAITPELERWDARQIAGGIGGFIVSATYLSPDARAIPGQIGLCGPQHLPGHRRLIAAGRAAGVAMLLQLAHAGRDGALLAVGEPSTAQLDALPALFANGARLAREAGYDGAQIHSAHGYFLSQFLHPGRNRRTDAYGGSPAGRRKLLLDIQAAMRAAAGEDFLLSVKLDCRDLDGSPGVFEACLEAAQALDAAGIDLVEISGLGGNKGLCDGPGQAESVFAPEAAAVAAAIRAPVALVGANRSPEVMERIVNETAIAFFSLSRPLLCEPELPRRWREGDRSPSRCVSCGGCYDAAGNRCLFAEA
ncbi:MAG: NADH:flavin oxidoreductase [Solidesulfovibrio sp.]|uniref:oxidoreductase n=1 Tax=Solidesulfovibrio sp. TaxID=2910990 RepID=UPI002B1F7F62|nr:NADH:flavin oxidoreductase [Solidesulfovibrio sp.]MEA4855158.1 NADH:flavin oxidoreductase [Solidesulfovibrio sp.]